MYITKQANKIDTKSNLMRLQREFPDSLALQTIFKLVCCDIRIENPFISISANEEVLYSTDIISLTNDSEIIARWCDMLLCAKIDVVINSLPAYRHYIIAYRENDDWNLALRAFSLVKQRRGLYSRCMEEIYDDVKFALNSVKHPNQFKEILSVAVSFIDKEELRIEYEAYTQNVLEEAKGNLDFDNAITCVEILEILGSISIIEKKKQKSYLLESDADNILSSADETTLCPNVLQKYSSALKEISSLPNTEVDKERISKKMLKEQLHSAKMMTYFSVPMEINRWDIYEEMVTTFNIDSPLAAFGAIINFPISPNDIISQQREESQENYSLLYSSIGTSIWRNKMGAVTSIKNVDGAIDDSIRRIGHFVTIEYLSVLVWIFNSAGECNTEPKVIDRFLRMRKSRFIPNDRVALYVQGLWAGFKGDYSMAAHILLPQIENSLRHIAQQHGIITTQLDKDIQHENMLGGVLDKIQHITNPDLWSDLKMFLLDGEGFRNQALHGLISINELGRNGLYLWWLCLKMIHRTDYYFGFSN